MSFLGFTYKEVFKKELEGIKCIHTFKNIFKTLNLKLEDRQFKNQEIRVVVRGSIYQDFETRKIEISWVGEKEGARSPQPLSSDTQLPQGGGAEDT